MALCSFVFKEKILDCSVIMELQVRLKMELMTCQILKEVYSRSPDLELRKVAFDSLNKRMEEIDNALLCLQRAGK